MKAFLVLAIAGFIALELIGQSFGLQVTDEDGQTYGTANEMKYSILLNFYKSHEDFLLRWKDPNDDKNTGILRAKRSTGPIDLDDIWYRGILRSQKRPSEASLREWFIENDRFLLTKNLI